MKKFNKRNLIYIAITVIAIVIYMFITKEKDNIGETQSLLIENQNSQELSEDEDTTRNIIVVYITGAVKNPDIYEMYENDRVADLIEKAGGVTEQADTNNINIAFKLEDEMRVHIPTKTETQAEAQVTTQMQEEDNFNITNSKGGYISTEKSGLEKQENNENSKNQKININTATQSELETLPGIGPSTALKIIEYRKQTGKFKTIEDIKNVKGIGESKYEKVKNLIKV